MILTFVSLTDKARIYNECLRLLSLCFLHCLLFSNNWFCLFCPFITPLWTAWHQQHRMSISCSQIPELMSLSFRSLLHTYLKNRQGQCPTRLQAGNSWPIENGDLSPHWRQPWHLTLHKSSCLLCCAHSNTLWLEVRH